MEVSFSLRKAEAKKKSLVELLKAEGHILTDTGSYYRCLSPLRNENNGSFDINKKTGRFTDRGDEKEGDIIDFVMLYKNLSFRDAIDYLLKDSINIPTYTPEVREKKNVEIISCGDIQSNYLLEYIKARSLDLNVCREYLKELQIRLPYGKNPEKIITILGFKNDSGGYELRNKYRKISNSPKNITTIQGTKQEITLLFESWPDFLSYLTLFKITRPYNKCIILNSISFLGSVIPFLSGCIVCYWGQNDRAGQKALLRLRREGVTAIDKRNIYKDHKDLNEYLIRYMNKKLTKIFMA